MPEPLPEAPPVPARSVPPDAAASRSAFALPGAGLAVALAVALGAGCAAFVPPKPSPYPGADTVDAVSEDVFLGDWRLVALNPPDGQEVPERTLSYASDGTFTGEIEPTAEMARLTGEEPIRLRGTWRVDAGRLVHATQEVEVPGDGGFVSRMLSDVMNRSDPLAASAEIYETGTNRIVVVTDEGYANALERP